MLIADYIAIISVLIVFALWAEFDARRFPDS
jgi:hypothetical protein